MWHRDFDADVKEMWDILAKALMLNAGGSVTISRDALRVAAETQAEIQMDEHGTVTFRVERQ
jgi:hypothetical protein